jgi:antitoxin component YwqK of YwqJK toxin-antitoxin module
MARPVLAVMLSLAALSQAGSPMAGHPDRVEQVFARDGTLLSQTAYREGRKVGAFISNWPDGTPRVRAIYDGDVIEGEYRAWHANGRLAELKHYSNGHQVGLQQAWTDGGELFLNFEVRNGRHYGLINSRPCLPVQGSM